MRLRIMKYFKYNNTKINKQTKMQQDINSNIYEGYYTRRSQMQPSTHRQQHSNIRYLPCKFHPNNNLQSFCLSSGCMLPMCHSCISIHNQDHYQTKTHGNYKDLIQLIKTTVEGIEQQCVMLQQLSTQYVQDYNSKLENLQKCKDIVNKTKIKIHEELDRIFQKISLDIQQKINNFSELLHELYNSLQQKIHNNYKSLSQKKSSLELSFKQTQFSQTFTKQSSQSQKTNNFTPGNTTLTYNIQQNEHKKQQRKILKTLIQYHSNNQHQLNITKIHKMKQEINKLKLINFDIKIDIKKINKCINQICKQCVKICQSYMKQSDIYKQKYEGLKTINGNSQTVSHKGMNMYDNNAEINEILRQTHQRLKKMQLSSTNSNFNIKKQLPVNIVNYKPQKL